LTSAKFDPVTYDSVNKIHGDVYVCVSDFSDNNKSKVIRINPESSSVIWEWGSKIDKENGVSDSFALSINDVFPSAYSDLDLIIST